MIVAFGILVLDVLFVWYVIEDLRELFAQEEVDAGWEDDLDVGLLQAGTAANHRSTAGVNDYRTPSAETLEAMSATRETGH